MSSIAHAQSVDWVVTVDDIYDGSTFDPIPAGGTIAYRVEIDNGGPDGALGTDGGSGEPRFEFEVPAGTELVSTTGGLLNCSPTSGNGALTVQCDLPDLSADSNLQQIFNVRTSAVGTVSVSAEVIGVAPGQVDTLSANNDDGELTTTTAGADIDLQLTAPTSAPAGAQVNFVLTATNTGPNTSNGFTFEFPTPAGVVGLTAPAGCIETTGTWRCSVSDPVPLNGDVTRTFSGQIAASGSSNITASASVSGQDPADPVPTNNTAIETITVSSGTDVRLGKSRAPIGALLVGDSVTFTLDATYRGDAPGPLVLTDTVPGNYAITNITEGAWSCSQTGQDVTCTHPGGTISGGENSLGSVIIDADVVSAGSAQNTASIALTTGPADQDLTNNTATDGSVTISPPTVDLRANKTGPNPALAVVGQSYEWQISTSNIGNTGFTGTIVMTDTVPDSLRITTVDAPAGWICNTPTATGEDVTCRRDFTQADPLGANQTTGEIRLTGEVVSAGTITNGLNITTQNANLVDANTANDVNSHTVTSVASVSSADISLIKSASADPVIAGQVQTYTLEVVNPSAVTSLDIDVTDTLANLINNGVGATDQGLISISTSAGVATGVACSSTATAATRRQLTCRIDSLPQCSAATDCPVITVAVRPGGNAGTYTNTARAVSQTTPDPDLDNNSGSASYTLTPRADMTVVKTATPDPVAAGQPLTYVITAQNLANGLSQAENVQISDTLPAGLTFLSASGPGATCGTQPDPANPTGPGNNSIVCDLGTISNGGQRAVTVQVQPNNVTRSTNITNAASVTTSTTETDLTNNSDSVSVAVAVPNTDILINKVDNIDPVTVGDTAIYTITVTNAGPSASENPSISDTLPNSRVSYQSHTVSGAGTCSSVPAVNSFGQTLACSWPNLPAGDSETVTVTVLATAKGTLSNTATVSSDEIVGGWDRIASNNTSTQVTTVRTRADMQITKTASVSSIELLENFTWTLDVAANSGPGLAEADDVVVRDTLPAGMELTGTPSITSGTCTGVAGATAFSCDLGTVNIGAPVQITVPVQVIAVTSRPQTFTNTATVETSSYDVDTTNNQSSDSVQVQSSSLSGTVFRDFADDAVLNGIDSGIAGVQVTMTGTDIDGNAVSLTVTTDASGNYTFARVPEGVYTVTRGTVSEAHLIHGEIRAGTEGGTAAARGGNTITAISLPGNTASTGYTFAEIPQARVGLAKALSGPAQVQADGSFVASFDLTAENLSLEPLVNVEITDTLTGANPLFGTLNSSAGISGALAVGEYSMVTAPSGSCGGGNAGFNGDSNQTVATGITLAANSSCLISFALRIQPVRPVPAQWLNQAQITAAGQASGQTTATNPNLADLSDNGADPDPDGDGLANEAGENDPTPVSVAFNPAIALVKTADTSALQTPVQPGDLITYRFTVTNTGNVTLNNINVTDPLVGLSQSSGSYAGPLLPGASHQVFSATYAVTQPDIDTGEVVNQARATGDSPHGTEVDDDSGTQTDNDTPLTTPLNVNAQIELQKTADASALQSPPQAGDVITYSFTVANTGTVTLSNVTVADPLPGVVLNGTAIAQLVPGQSDTSSYTATYAITQADIIAGQVSNTATASGLPAGETVPVTDPDSEVVPLQQSPSVQLQKFADNSGLLNGSAPGDVLPYRFTVTNTGNIPLTNLTVTDSLPGAVLSGGPIPQLNPGEADSVTYTANYTITASDITAGEVINNAAVTGTWGPNPGETVDDTDSVTAQVGSIDAISEVFPAFSGDGGTTTSMLASDLLNQQPATLDTVTITVLRADPGVTLDPSTGLITLAPGHPAGPHTVEYQICSIIVPTLCDTAVETVLQGARPGIEATKFQTYVDNGDGRNDVGDRVDYTITLENTGNIPLQNVTVVDTLTDLNGTPLTLDRGPDFESADLGSPEGRLEIGETATYSASYTLTLSDVNARGVSNEVLGTGTTVVPTGLTDPPQEVSDDSDDGIDTDGNNVDDPTVTTLTPSVSLPPRTVTVTKTTPRKIVARGSVVPYTITVENSNPFVVGPIDIVDLMPTGLTALPDTATLDGQSAPMTVNGRSLRWHDVDVPAQGSITLTVSGQVLNGARAGRHVNTVNVYTAGTDDPLTPPTTAEVEILPDALLECADVIGKVFADHNGNGHQDDPKGKAAANRAAITDQTYHGGKWKGALSPAQDAPAPETGIPGARLMATDGTIITTDEHGRYSLPCAALPQNSGGNFILKLDERSLPDGYRPTTENPRVMRLTPGMMSEMNFGVAKGTVVRIDLNAAGFVTDRNGRQSPSTALRQAIDQMIPRLPQGPLVLHLAWHLSHDAPVSEVREGHANLKEITVLVQNLWHATGRAPLHFTTEIVRAAQ
ncbi:hypothetical protein MHM39_06560 [Phaeobacter sp. CNT1-3]|nr:hypothetical protein [Phaeobacter sp. CNT1-3]